MERAIVRTVPPEAATANFVPAAAVIRRWQALFGFTGRTGCVGGLVSLLLKLRAQPGKRRGYCQARGWERSGIPGVAVKCVEIGRKAGGEGGALEHT